mgnify:CR=1 FL=1
MHESFPTMYCIWLLSNFNSILRVKVLKTEAFSQEEADRAAGMGSYKAPKTFDTDLPEMDTDTPSGETSTYPATERKPGTSSAPDT